MTNDGQKTTAPFYCACLIFRFAAEIPAHITVLIALSPEHQNMDLGTYRLMEFLNANLFISSLSQQKDLCVSSCWRKVQQIPRPWLLLHQLSRLFELVQD